MITLTLAQDLKRAGLVWSPKTGDSFAVPLPGLDDRVYYITDIAIRVATLHGHPTIMFQGAYEWALDYIMLTEVVWIPREGQLRREIEARLPVVTAPTLSLIRISGGYVCEITDHDGIQTHAGEDAASAYAHTLLHLLKREQPAAEERTP